MISLFTGGIGSGKTCKAVGEMVSLLKEGRPLFVHGIPELTIPHEIIVCTAKSCKFCPKLPAGDYLIAEDWHEWAPEGAIIFMDEVQHIYRPRHSSKSAPASVMAFETSRHDGLDFILITQSPKLIDSNIRVLVNRHIHIKPTWANRLQFEWSECQPNTASVSTAVKSTYKLDKKIFKLYKSSSFHTKLDRKIPVQLYLIPVLVLALLFMANRVYSSIDEKTQGQLSNSSLDLSEAGGVAHAQPSPNHIITLADYEPLIAGYPETAPIYSKLLKVTDFPRIVACVYNNDSGDCKCYTQQGTRYKTTLSICYGFAVGNEFNPYQVDTKKTKTYDSTAASRY